jgi:hypothetical protein
MNRIALLVCLSILAGCSTRRLPVVEPAAPSLKHETAFPQPTDAQSNQLARLDTLLRGPDAKLNLSWVAEMGLVAVPTCAREAGDETLSANARDLMLIVSGNALYKAEFCEDSGARNDLVVPVMLKALNDEEPRVRRSAGYAARFVDDSRLVPALEARLSDAPAVQEQAVLALGTSGREPEIVPIMKLFLGTDSGTFRYSCLYSLAMMCLLHDIDVASVLRQNAATFGEKNRSNLESVTGRFVDFRAMAILVRRLSSTDPLERRDADEKLRKLTGKTMGFDPAGDLTTRQRGSELWRKYFLKDYWLAPSPSKP